MDHETEIFFIKINKKIKLYFQQIKCWRLKLKKKISKTRITPHKAYWKKKYEVQSSNNLILNDKTKEKN